MNRRKSLLKSLLSFAVMIMLIPSVLLQATDPDISFDKIALDQGLSQVTIRCIFQDSRGFMWFGTRDGLNKYDGYRFTIYRPDEDDPATLSDIGINVIYEDGDGMLWIGADDGLNRFDRKHEIFTRYLHDKDNPHSLSSGDVSAIAEDAGGRLWVGTRNHGLNRMDRDAETFTRFQPTPGDSGALKNPRVTALYLDNVGVLWVGTAGGWVHRLHAKKDRFTASRIPAGSRNWEGEGTLPVKAILDDGSGRLIVGVDGSGLHRLDRETGVLDAGYLHNAPGEVGSDIEYLSALRRTRDGALWIGTRNRGLIRYSPQRKTFRVFRNRGRDPRSLSADFITSLYEDRSGLLWIGTQSNGINRTRHERTRFTHYRNDPNDPGSLINNLVRAFHEDREGNLWVGTVGGGVTRYGPRRRRTVHFQHDPEDPGSLGGDFIRCMLVDSTGALWIGADGGGLNLYRPRTETFHHYFHTNKDPASLSHNAVVSLAQTRHPRNAVPSGGPALWIGTWGGGLNRFDPRTGLFTRFIDRSDDPHQFSNRFITCIHEDAHGALWLGTINGLTRFNRDTGAFTCYCGTPNSPTGLKKRMVTAILEDNAGVLWFGTIGGGLIRFDPRSGAFRTYLEKDGLPNNVINGLLLDELGNLWIPTNKGLTRFNPVTGEFRNYDGADGLQSNEFNSGAFYKSARGEMFFGGINGFNAFFPQEIKDNPYIPPVAITDFKIFNRSVPIGAGRRSPLRESISEAAVIRLEPHQDVISFQFAALNYINTKKNRYAYKLDGFDADWVETGTRRFASYTNLGDGEYVFRVKGSNNDGVWNEEGAAVRIIVEPTFWESPWAYVLYAMIIAGILLGMRWFEHNRVRIRESELRALAAEAQSRAIHSEHMRQNHELEEARKLQLSMLPRELPHWPGLEIAVHMETATEVGGDYYDFHLDSDGTLAVAVGDATGHGLKAGTMVSVIKGLFCSENSHTDILAFFSKCTHTIKHMCLGNLYMALTLLTIRGDRLRLSNAGMPPLYLFRAASADLETVAIKGPPLGAFSNAVYKTRDILLAPGDTLLLCSDGLPELFDKNGEMFGYRRVPQLFERIAPGSPSEIIDALKKTAGDWMEGKPPDDDTTFVVIKVTPNPTGDNT